MKNIKTNWDYSQLAKNYDHRAEYDSSLIKKVLNDFECKKNFPVADIGAGTGKLTKQLLKQNLIVSAVEPNLNMRKFGIKNCKNFDKINWSAATAENTGLFEKNIYAVFFGSSFNVVDYKKVFKEKFSNYTSIYLSATLEQCKKRDYKGIYQMKSVPGVDIPFAEPLDCDHIIEVGNLSPYEIVQTVKSLIQ